MNHLQNNARKPGDYEDSTAQQNYERPSVEGMQRDPTQRLFGASKSGFMTIPPHNQSPYPENDSIYGNRSIANEGPISALSQFQRPPESVAYGTMPQESAVNALNNAQNPAFKRFDHDPVPPRGIQVGVGRTQAYTPQGGEPSYSQQVHSTQGGHYPPASNRPSGPAPEQLNAPRFNPTFTQSTPLNNQYQPTQSSNPLTFLPPKGQPSVNKNADLQQSTNLVMRHLSELSLDPSTVKEPNEKANFTNASALPPLNGASAPHAASDNQNFQGMLRTNVQNHPSTTEVQALHQQVQPTPSQSMPPPIQPPNTFPSAPYRIRSDTHQNAIIGSRFEMPQTTTNLIPPPQSNTDFQPAASNLQSRTSYYGQQQLPHHQQHRMSQPQVQPPPAGNPSLQQGELYSQPPHNFTDTQRLSYSQGHIRPTPQSVKQGYEMNQNAQIGQQANFRFNQGIPQQKLQEQQKLTTPRSHIDMDSVPSTVDVRTANQILFDDEVYRTSSDTALPFASTRYTSLDDGVCSPRFMRLTTYNFPSTSEICSSTCIPLGAIITPLAEPAYNENAVPVVNCGRDPPIRCTRCMAYVNPYFVFIDGGHRFICNLCSFEGETPRNHFMNLDMYGYRLDRKQSPEHCLGSYEFAVSGSFVKDNPQPASYLIAIDVTWYAIQSGAIKHSVLGLKDFLYNSATSGLPRGCKIAIITYDKSVHFYDLNPSSKEPRMMVVSDAEVFNPFNGGFFVDPIESRTLIEKLLDNIDKYFMDTRTAETATGLVVRVAYESLKNLGGKFILFQTMLPSYGMGALQNRCGPNNTGNENERALYRPQDSFWIKMGICFCKAGVCVDIFSFSNQYLDLATTGCLASLTGGDLHYYPAFNSEKYGKKLYNDIKSLLSRTFGFAAILKVRVSEGLSVNKQYGNYYSQNNSELTFGGIDSTKSIGVTLKYDHPLNERSKSFIQLALLYTTANGQRRLRIHNMAVSVTNNISHVFKMSNLDTIVNLCSKLSCENMIKCNLKTVRGIIVYQCIQILAAYRKFSPSTTSSGYLILPEAFKLYPICTLSLLKSPAFNEYLDISVDKRVYELHKLKHMTVEASVIQVYPRIFVLTEMLNNSSIGLTDSTGAVKLPPMVRASSRWLKFDHCYMLDNGTSLIIWISCDCNTNFINEVFGVASFESINASGSDLPDINTPLLQRLKNVVQYISYERGCYMPVYIARASIDIQAELSFSNALIEDENLGNTNYADFICSIHRSIQEELYD